MSWKLLNVSGLLRPARVVPAVMLLILGACASASMENFPVAGADYELPSGSVRPSDIHVLNGELGW